MYETYLRIVEGGPQPPGLDVQTWIVPPSITPPPSLAPTMTTTTVPKQIPSNGWRLTVSKKLRMTEKNEDNNYDE